MSANNFITQARIDDEKFNQIVQRCRNMRTEMNLQYCKLRRKTFSSIYSLPKEAIRNASPSLPQNRSPIRPTYTHSNKFFYENENAEKKKDQNIFVVTTVRVKAQRPDSSQVKSDSIKKTNPIKVPKVRSNQSRNEAFRK